MTRDNSDLRQLRRHSKEVYRVQRALSAFFGRTTRQIHETDLIVQRTLANGSRGQLKELAVGLQKDIESIRLHFAVKVPNEQIVEIVNHASRSSGTRELMLSKHAILGLCDGYHKTLPSLMEYPAHARVTIYPEGIDDSCRIDVTVLEIVIYEEMCALFNLWRSNDYSLAGGNNKVRIKTTNALAHATVGTAFNFVEAYLNGLAFNHVFGSITQLDEDKVARLLEWDTKKSRTRFVTFRDKLLDYPKIILDRQHPILDENNCTELKYVVETAKILRDALAHPSAKPQFDGTDTKESLLLEMDDAAVQNTVTSCIRLVHRIENTVSPGKDLHWLKEPRDNGLFSDEVFN